MVGVRACCLWTALFLLSSQRGDFREECSWDMSVSQQGEASQPLFPLLLLKVGHRLQLLRALGRVYNPCPVSV